MPLQQSSQRGLWWPSSLHGRWTEKWSWSLTFDEGQVDKSEL